MGKTGITQWVQVKGVKGQIRLVPKSEGELKDQGQTSGSGQAQPSRSWSSFPVTREGREAVVAVVAGAVAEQRGPRWQRQGHGKPRGFYRQKSDAPRKSFDNGRKAEVSPLIEKLT